MDSILQKVVAVVVMMGESDFLTPKAIAIQIKSKGLQKLHWYCQMCQKHCQMRMASSIIVCPNLRDIYYWLPEILSSLWIIFQKNSEMTF